MQRRVLKSTTIRCRSGRRTAGVGLAELVLALSVLTLISSAVVAQVVADTRRAAGLVRVTQLQFYAEGLLLHPGLTGDQDQRWVVTADGLFPAGQAAGAEVIDEIRVIRRETPVQPEGRRVVLLLTSERTFNCALVERFYEAPRN